MKDVFGEPYEVFNVDSSKHMNDFSRMIINKSRLDDDLPSGYSYRFNLPRDSTVSYTLNILVVHSDAFFISQRDINRHGS